MREVVCTTDFAPSFADMSGEANLLRRVFHDGEDGEGCAGANDEPPGAGEDNDDDGGCCCPIGRDVAMSTKWVLCCVRVFTCT